MDKSKRVLLDEFGASLMKHVRDDALAFVQRVYTGKMADATSKELFARLPKLDAKESEAVEELLETAVDAGIVRFLNFLDEFNVGVLFTDQAGQTQDVRATSDGLAGELHTEDGWIAKFSRHQRSA